MFCVVLRSGIQDSHSFERVGFKREFSHPRKGVDLFSLSVPPLVKVEPASSGQSGCGQGGSKLWRRAVPARGGRRAKGNIGNLLLLQARHQLASQSVWPNG